MLRSRRSWYHGKGGKGLTQQGVQGRALARLQLSVVPATWSRARGDVRSSRAPYAGQHSFPSRIQFSENEATNAPAAHFADGPIHPLSMQMEMHTGTCDGPSAAAARTTIDVENPAREEEGGPIHLR